VKENRRRGERWSKEQTRAGSTCRALPGAACSPDAVDSSSGCAGIARQQPGEVCYVVFPLSRDKTLLGLNMLKSCHLETASRSGPAVTWVMLCLSASHLGVSGMGTSG